MTEFSVRAMKLKLAGETDKRISEDSAIELREEMEEKAGKISEKAVEIAEEEGRVTVRSGDVKEASKEVLGGSSE